MSKPIALKKQEILDRWDAADGDIPPPIVPIDTGHKGSTFAEDSFRITGSQEWIDWCLARMKPLLELDGNGSRIEPVYMQTVKRSYENGEIVIGDLTGSWACYFKCKSRGSGRFGGRKLGSKNKPKDGSEPKAEKVPDPLRAVNAGLKLKGKPKTTEIDPKPASKQKTAPAYTEPRYAIARGKMNDPEHDTPDWLEPDDEQPPFPCKVYPDEMEVDDAAIAATKKHKLKRSEITKIEITIKDNGELIFDEY